MKKLFALVLVVVLAMALTVPAMADDVTVIGFAQVGHESDWRAANTIDYQTTFTAENGYELLFVDADNDHTAQMEAVRNFIQQEVDYIVICPVQEAGWEVVLEEAQDAGIPVIIADRTVSAEFLAAAKPTIWKASSDAVNIQRTGDGKYSIHVPAAEFVILTF